MVPNDILLDDIKKDVRVSQHTCTSTNTVYTYPDDVTITNTINGVNAYFSDESRTTRIIYIHKFINCGRPYDDGGKKPTPLTDKDRKDYKVGTRSKLRMFAFKIYVEQLPNGVHDFIKRVKAVDKSKYQILAIIHDRDQKLDIHDLYVDSTLKPHVHIIVRCCNGKTVHVQTIMNMLGIVFRKGIDDSLIVRNKGIDTIHKTFAHAATYLTHDTEEAAKCKEHYELEEIISNLTIDEIKEVRDGYIKLAASTAKVDKQHMAELDNYAFNLGYELKDFDDWYNTLTFAERCTASMKVVRESYYRGCQKKFDEHIQILRKCIFVQGEPNQGKTYAAIQALSGNKILCIGGGGTGKFDRLKPSHNAIVIDDDVCPNLLNIADNYACQAYRRGANNPIWAGEWLVVTSNESFGKWLISCGFREDDRSHRDALRSRFFICHVGDDTKELYLDDVNLRGTIAEQKQRMRDFLQFKKAFNDTIKSYHANLNSDTFDAEAFVCSNIDNPFRQHEETRQERALKSLYDGSQ